MKYTIHSARCGFLILYLVSEAQLLHYSDRLLDFYNQRRPHSRLDRRTPDEAYFTPSPLAAAA